MQWPSNNLPGRPGLEQGDLAKSPTAFAGSHDHPADWPRNRQSRTSTPVSTRPIEKIGCRVFPAYTSQISEQDLASLSDSITNARRKVTTESKLPAGYLFLGQFIEHDITRIDTDDHPQAWQSLGRRSFDLECVYGSAANANLLRDVAHPDKLILGKTIGTGDYGVQNSLPCDLPRIISGERPGRAFIGDPRNDANLGLAQTHVQFLKLHNRFVDCGMTYREARQATVQHYQSIVINDFLKRILDPNVFNAAIQQPDYLCFTPLSDFMPFEFIMAAYRFTFAMFKEEYEWNPIMQTGGAAGPATLADIYRLSELGGNLDGHLRLPTHWVIDWRRFYEFSPESPNPDLNTARAIGETLVEAINPLTDKLCDQGSATGNLAMRMLRLGRQHQLASGQTVVDILNERGMMLRKLDAEQLDTGSDQLNQDTPLWYYILRESQVQQNGQRLGEVGSWLIADTFKKLIFESPNCVLNDTRFAPHPDVLNGRKTVTMPGIIEFSGDISPGLETAG